MRSLGRVVRKESLRLLSIKPGMFRPKSNFLEMTTYIDNKKYSV